MKAVINNSLHRYIDIGIPNAAPVIFIHGFPFSHRMWSFPGGQTEALSSTHRVVAYDVRGHGESEVGTGHYSIEFFVDDLIGLMDHLQIRTAVLCGLSMGGYIALRAAERHPERLSGLVLCDTKSEADTNEARVKRAASIRNVQINGMKAYAAEYVKGVFAPESFERRADAVKMIQSIVERTAPLSIFGTLMALGARTDTTAALQHIACPTLILVGEKDLLTPPAAAQAMKDRIPNARLHVVPQAAHMSNLENPEVFNGHLKEFLASLK
ncbi:MAG: alpha/beta fold hydrolase [Bacteroidetes bacterium]|nr:MAG: alpha/beta fold hydrolase [Bacteroidota bacterium]